MTCGAATRQPTPGPGWCWRRCRWARPASSHAQEPRRGAPRLQPCLPASTARAAAPVVRAHAGPLLPNLPCPSSQLAAIFVLIGEALGYPASLAGCATLLLLIPTQALLARRITRLRAAAAAATDARVRLTSEALNGVLAAKMLVWEAPLLRALGALRAAEAAPLRRMARIRAANQALSWAVAPLSALGVFGVARAVGDELSVPTVFYAIALLSIPKLCERGAAAARAAVHGRPPHDGGHLVSRRTAPRGADGRTLSAARPVSPTTPNPSCRLPCRPGRLFRAGGAVSGGATCLGVPHRRIPHPARAARAQLAAPAWGPWRRRSSRRGSRGGGAEPGRRPAARHRGQWRRF